MVLHAQYFPSITWMHSFLLQHEVEIEQWEHYQKQGLRNRCRILGAEGVITLSVPLVGGREQKTFMKDIKINNSSKWNINHQRTIKSCYSKAPFFDHYFEPIEKLLSQKHSYLLELNMQVLNLLIGWFRWEGHVSFTQSFKKQDFQPMISSFQVSTYIQIFSDRRPFEPGLSILDVLFCLGPQTKNLLLN